jgi:SPX domain protein involved in polyphosphate accumulation
MWAHIRWLNNLIISKSFERRDNFSKYTRGVTVV